jgi:hypothetical protein
MQYLHRISGQSRSQCGAALVAAKTDRLPGRTGWGQVPLIFDKNQWLSLLSRLFCEICFFPLVLVIVHYFSSLLIVFCYFRQQVGTILAPEWCALLYFQLTNPAIPCYPLAI